MLGTLEVHFKDENSAGSAVKREWFLLGSEAFLAPEAGLLSSLDGGRTFRPSPLSAATAEGPPSQSRTQPPAAARLAC
jgi:hypothetical protein